MPQIYLKVTMVHIFWDILYDCFHLRAQGRLMMLLKGVPGDSWVGTSKYSYPKQHDTLPVAPLKIILEPPTWSRSIEQSDSLVVTILIDTEYAIHQA